MGPGHPTLRQRTRAVVRFPVVRAITEPVGAAARTAVFFLKVLPMLPSGPLDWLTPAPVVEQVRYPTRDGPVAGDLYRPGGAGPHPGIVICLGVVPFGVEHPQVPRLGTALARAGFAALLYWSPAMRDLRLDPHDTENIARAYQWLIEQPGIDAAHSGLLGTCVGGAFALLAAAQPAIRDRVAFVTAWAPYASMRTLARDIAGASTTAGEAVQPWAVDQLTRKVYVRSLTEILEPAEAERLRATCAERAEQPCPSDLSADGRAVFPLLTSLDRATAQAAVDALPIAMQQRLDAMSPLHIVDAVRAPLLVLAHDRNDQVIPIAESRRLRDACAGHPGLRYTEFAMFKHLDPAQVRLSPLALARELLRFYITLYPIFRQAAGAGGHCGYSRMSGHEAM